MVELKAENGRFVYIPESFGPRTGERAAMTNDVGLAYKVADYNSPGGKRIIIWNDPDLAIPCPLSAAERSPFRTRRVKHRVARCAGLCDHSLMTEPAKWGKVGTRYCFEKFLCGVFE
jgi:hypothetical protein